MNEFKFPYTENELYNITFQSKAFVVQGFVNEIVCAFGITVSQRYDQAKNRMIFNLNTRTKSEFHIVSNPSVVCDENATWEFRYDKVIPMTEHTNLMDVLESVRDCMHGRDSIGDQWLKALAHYDILRVRTRTVTEIVR